MSTGFDMLITPGDSYANDPLGFYARVLSCVLHSPHVRRSGIKLTAYREQRPFSHGPGSHDPNLILQQRFDNGRSADQVVEAIRGIRERNVLLGVDCTYDRLKWNNDLCDAEPSGGWLVIEYESKGFAMAHGARTRGSHRIHFDRRNEFSLDGIDLAKCPITNPQMLPRFVKYGGNIEFVKGLVRAIVNATRPSNVVLITEGAQNNPANFHMVYHDRIRGYENDARKMLQLHREGGGYYEDDLRTAGRAKEFRSQLDLYAAFLGDDEFHLADEEIAEIITARTDVEAEIIGKGLLSTHSSFLFGYLDSLYQTLLEQLASKPVDH